MNLLGTFRRNTRLSAFKVVSISSNTNSFGLYGIILVNEEGLKFEVAASEFNLPKERIINVELNENDNLVSTTFSYEIPRKLPNVSPEILKQIWPN